MSVIDPLPCPPDPSGGVASVDGLTGVVDLSGIYQPLDADLTDIANLADVQGDILVRGAAGWERLAKSVTATDVLTAGASQPAWAAATGGSQTPWVSNVDADTFTLSDLGGVAIGTTALGGTGLPQLLFDLDRTSITGAVLQDVRIVGTTTFTTATGGTYTTLHIAPTIAGNIAISSIFGLNFVPTITNSAAITSLTAGLLNANHGIGTVATSKAVTAQVSENFGTTTLGIGVDVVSVNTGGTFTEMVGLRVTNLAGGTTRWGLQVGDYQSYHEGDLRVGAISAASAAAPNAKLDVIQETIASDVARFSSVATNDDVVERILQARVATTDATVTTLHAITCAVDTTTVIRTTVVARRTGGAAGAAQDGAGYTMDATFKNTAGTVAQIGATVQSLVNESQAAWACVFDVTGATARIRVTGATDNNVTWHSTSHIFQVST